MNNEFLNTDFSLLFESTSQEIETASVDDQDLLRIRCFSVHEGLNENGTAIFRQVLLDNYRSFIDKPVVIVTDRNDKPTGHGYDFKNKRFIESKRRYVGHITNAFPCIVCEDGSVQDVTDIPERDYPKGEFRIVCDLVIYKRYLGTLAETLANLHIDGKLKFSMESLMDAKVTPDGIKHCTNIHFTALAIVQFPAWRNCYSLEVAEKEERSMDFEQLYKDEQEKNSVLVAEKAAVVTERDNLSEEVTRLKEELAETKGVIADKDAEIQSLTVYKNKVETAEKEAVGKERKERLEKYGETKYSAEELAEMTKEDFVEALESAVDSYVPAAPEVGEKIMGAFISESATKSKGARLAEILGELSK